MAETLRVARLFFVLLVLVTTGRWLMGTFGVPYEKGHHVFSVVILTIFSCLYYGAFTRRWLDYRLIQAGMLGVIFGYRPDDRPYTGLSLTHGNAQAVTLAPALNMGLRAIFSLFPLGLWLIGSEAWLP